MKPLISSRSPIVPQAISASFSKNVAMAATNISSIISRNFHTSFAALAGVKTKQSAAKRLLKTSKGN